MRVRLEYKEDGSTASLQLLWTPPGGSQQVIPGSALSPAYGLATSSTTDDSAPSGVSGVSSSQVPSLRTATGYGTPLLGIATSTTVDPGGLNLTTAQTSEPFGTTGYLRSLTRTLPAGNTVSSNAYYTETGGYAAQVSGGATVCGVDPSTPQYGMLMSTTGAAPASGAAIVTSYVYDVLGRVVGTKSTGDTGWSCTTYDARSRTTRQVLAATGSSPARTATFGYADGSGDPLTNWAQDDAVPGSPTNGRITTITDLLGRVVSYTDVWGTVTTGTYNRLNQLLTQISTPAGQSGQTQQFAYDDDGRVTAVKDGSGKVLAQPSYTAGELVGVAYPSGTGNAGNGTSGAWTRNPAGALASAAWTFASGQPGVADQVVRSQSGRVLTDTVTDGSTTFASSYGYDAAGRLVSATIPHHRLTYGYAGSGGCGVDAAAGKNGNRTSFADSVDGAAAQTTTYCYDNADRLTSTGVPAGTGSTSPIFSTSLGAGTLAYDAAGNTTTLADESLGYDQSGRHVSTVVAGGGERVVCAGCDGSGGGAYGDAGGRVGVHGAVFVRRRRGFHGLHPDHGGGGGDWCRSR